MIVVGPNGCGKSNVADAFRWVLGEQSARSLRGHKMPDVIFAGTSERKGQNVAEVSLTLEDVPGKNSSLFDSVTITRRLYRSGESDYLINDHIARLKDVQELLFDSGVGNDMYAFFEQGKIDEVIRLAPIERRYIFEEAAGIKRFLQKKKEALRKLEQTKGNIERVRDLHREIERQVMVLERQAEEAKLYQEKKGELESLERVLLEEKWLEWSKKRAQLQHKIDAADQAFADLNLKNTGFEGASREMKEQLLEIEKSLRARSERVFQCHSTKEIHTKEREGSLLRLRELQEREEQLTAEIETIQEKREQEQKEKGALKASLAVVEKKRKTVQEELKLQSDSLHAQENMLKEERADYQRKQKSLLESTQKQQGMQGELKQLEVRLENGSEREKYLRSRKGVLREQLQAADKLSKEGQKNFEKLLEALDEKRETMELLETQLADLMSEIETQDGRYEGINRLLADARARHKALKALQDEMEGFSAGAQKLLKASASPASPLYKKLKPLYASFTPKKGIEKAVATVMAPYTQTLVVETLRDFSLVTQFAATHKIADFSLICLEMIDTPQKKKTIKRDQAQLSYHLTGNDLTNHFLGSISLSEKKSLTPIQQNSCHLDGWFVDEHLVVFFPKSEASGVFVRVAEIKELEQQIASREKEGKQLEQVLNALQAKRREVQEESVVADKAIRQLEIKSAEMNVTLQKSKSERERILAEARKVEGEIEATCADMVIWNRQKNGCAEAVSAALKKAAAIQRDVELAAEKVEKFATELKKKSEAVKLVEAGHQLLLDERQKLLNALTIIDVKYEESQQQTKRIKEELQAGSALQTQIGKRGEELKRLLAADEKALAEATKAKMALEEELLKLQQKMRLLQTKTDQATAEWRKQQEARHQLHVQSAQMATQIEALSKELQEKYGISSAAISEKAEITKGGALLESRIKQLRREVDSSKAVNMLSIEEHAQCQERHQAIHYQLEDMEEAEKELIAVIMELDEESRAIFKETFAKIRENFQKNFAILFSGGEADLQFVDSTDVLEAGIEIVAKPPGKQMRSIQLLSGGEKCLTALALLFAIFEVKPSPFCILDEIDAPLDDANVERFVKLVKQFSDVCQFIVITHNKRTMTIADRIFGVTMEEKGISKLLTLDLETTQTGELVNSVN